MADKQKKGGKKDNWFKRHKVWTGIIGVVLLLIIIGGVSGDSPKTQDNVQTANGVQVTDKSKGYRFNDRADKQEKDVEIVPGESALLDGMKMTVNEVTKLTAINDYTTAPSGKTYVVATVTLENTSDRAKPYNVYDFRIQTSGGQVLDSYWQSPDPALNSGDLVQGGKVTGKVTFEAPVETAPQYIIWKPSAFDGGRAIVQVQ